MKKKDTKDLGKLGEDIAIKYLKKDKGWKIIGRNFSKPWGEMDIIARDKNTIIFVEVKTLSKSSAKYFKPEEHFDMRKREKTIRIAHSYLLQNGYPEETIYRIDLAALEVDNERKIARMRYYENAIA